MKISDSEWKIMEVLWKSPSTITQLTEQLFEETKWKKNTVISFLNRMVKKGSVYYEQGEKNKIFFPACKREEAQMEQVRKVLNRSFLGNSSLFATTFVKNEQLSDDEIDQICKMLQMKKVDKDA